MDQMLQFSIQKTSRQRVFYFAISRFQIIQHAGCTRFRGNPLRSRTTSTKRGHIIYIILDNQNVHLTSKLQSLTGATIIIVGPILFQTNCSQFKPMQVTGQ